MGSEGRFETTCPGCGAVYDPREETDDDHDEGCPIVDGVGGGVV